MLEFLLLELEWVIVSAAEIMDVAEYLEGRS